MTQTYFLGANSRDGFASLYSGFPGGEGDFLHIVKGGPGTGKSGFMRRIGQAAEERGLDVHYVLCSGDPASLDGVYLPALRLAWVDGTAPHTAEPRAFGVDSDYVNLGVFCCTPFSRTDRAEIEQLTKSYRGLYGAAYRALAEVRCEERSPGLSHGAAELPEALEERRARPSPPDRRFLRAISCEGEIDLSGEAEALCPDMRIVSRAVLGAVSREAERRRLPALRCCSALDASQLEALLFPWAGLAFRVDTVYRGLEPAVEKLRSAKLLHDEIEAIVRPYMDFAGLSDFTEKTVGDLFG